jgi:hypothetical protein
MNEKDKQAVDAAKATKQPSSRTPRQSKTGSQQSAESAGENLQGQLAQMSEQMGVAIADNVTAQALMIGFTKLQKGEYGPMTQGILQSVQEGLANPFTSWTAQIEQWHQPIALLPSSLESTPL